MHDPDGVRLRHALERLEHVSDRDMGREAMRRLPFEDLREVLAVEQLEDHVRVAQLLIDVVDADHVLVLDVRCRAPLVDEALRRLGVARVGEHDLDRDGLRELDVLRSEHRAHAALPEEPIERRICRDHVPRTGKVRRSWEAAHVRSRVRPCWWGHKRAAASPRWSRPEDDGGFACHSSALRAAVARSGAMRRGPTATSAHPSGTSEPNLCRAGDWRARRPD